MPKIALSLSAKTTGSLPSRNSRIRSIGLSAGPTWSIGSSATNNDPSGAVATWQGYCTAGTAATRRIVNPSGTLGNAASAGPVVPVMIKRPQSAETDHLRPRRV